MVLKKYVQGALLDRDAVQEVVKALRTAWWTQRAEAELRAVETITLRDADRDAYFAALASPTAPNAALRKLFAEGRRR